MFCFCCIPSARGCDPEGWAGLLVLILLVTPTTLALVPISAAPWWRVFCRATQFDSNDESVVFYLSNVKRCSSEPDSTSWSCSESVSPASLPGLDPLVGASRAYQGLAIMAVLLYFVHAIHLGVRAASSSTHSTPLAAALYNMVHELALMTPIALSAVLCAAAVLAMLHPVSPEALMSAAVAFAQHSGAPLASCAPASLAVDVLDGLWCATAATAFLTVVLLLRLAYLAWTVTLYVLAARSARRASGRHNPRLAGFLPTARNPRHDRYSLPITVESSSGATGRRPLRSTPSRLAGPPGLTRARSPSLASSRASYVSPNNSTNPIEVHGMPTPLQSGVEMPLQIRMQ